LRDPFIKWQYYGTEEGAFCVYPGSDRDLCDDYDCRFRPWYVAAVASEPKYVVLIIDTSGSMELNDRISTAIDAAVVALSTLSPQDYVNVIAFNNVATLPDGDQFDNCFEDLLVPATPANIALLTEWVRSFVPGGGTEFISTFQLAYGLIENWLSSGDGAFNDFVGVILFLTDGEASDPYTTIDALRAGLDNEPTIFSFALGSDIEQNYLDVLESIALLTGGAFTAVDDGNSDLRTVMGEYYTHPSVLSPASGPLYTVPYIDASGLGLVTTAAIPFYVDGVFRGVVGIDLALSDLFVDVTFFKEGKFSYAFVVDEASRTLYHPLLPDPSDISLVHFVDILDLETDPDFVSLVHPGLMDRSNGSATFMTSRSFARGGKQDGTKFVEFEATFYWQPIVGTNFSLGLVIATSDNVIQTVAEADMPLNEQHYHRLDVENAGEGLCQHFQNYASNAHSTVYIPPAGFVEPMTFQTRNETVEEIQGMTRYFQDGAEDNDFFTSSVRSHVLATAPAEDWWLDHNTEDITSLVTNRYVGNAFVFRIFPGGPSSPNYDPSLRPWYRLAQSTPELYTLSTPYVDASGAGLVVTLSRAILKPTLNSVDPEDQQVAAVMGVDFRLPALQTILQASVPGCAESDSARCFLLDFSGYIVMDDDFVCNNNYDTTWIGERMPEIGERLLAQELLDQTVCSNFVDITVELHHESTFGGSSNLAIEGTTGCGQTYFLSTVPQTNVFLLVVESDNWPATCTSDESCACEDICTEASCSSPGYDQSGCSCPCTCELSFDDCSASFTGDDIPVCPAQPTPLIPRVLTSNIPQEVCFPNFEECPVDNSLSIGEIVGIVLGGLVALGCAIFIVHALTKETPKPARSRQNRANSNGHSKQANRGSVNQGQAAVEMSPVTTPPQPQYAQQPAQYTPQQQAQPQYDPGYAATPPQYNAPPEYNDITPYMVPQINAPRFSLGGSPLAEI
jgi:Mg-chelatase subunit ChlD